MTFFYQRKYILLSNHVFTKNPKNSQLPKTPKTPNLLVDKNPTKTSTKNSQKILPKIPNQMVHPKIPVTRLRDIFIILSFSIYIRIQKKNTYTLKNRKNRVNDVSKLILNHLATQNRVKIAYP